MTAGRTALASVVLGVVAIVGGLSIDPWDTWWLRALQGLFVLLGAACLLVGIAVATATGRRRGAEGRGSRLALWLVAGLAAYLVLMLVLLLFAVELQ